MNANVFILSSRMENFDRENIDELLEIRQIRQYFPCQNFAPYSTLLKVIFIEQLIVQQFIIASNIMHVN